MLRVPVGGSGCGVTGVGRAFLSPSLPVAGSQQPTSTTPRDSGISLSAEPFFMPRLTKHVHAGARTRLDICRSAHARLINFLLFRLDGHQRRYRRGFSTHARTHTPARACVCVRTLPAHFDPVTHTQRHNSLRPFLPLAPPHALPLSLSPSPDPPMSSLQSR